MRALGIPDAEAVANAIEVALSGQATSAAAIQSENCCHGFKAKFRRRKPSASYSRR